MKCKVFSLVAACLVAVTSFAADKMTSGAELGTWTMDAAAAFDLAKEQGKPVFINFTGSDWCGWCKLMDRAVFSKEAWQAYAKENLVLLWVDFPQDKSLVPEAIAPQNEALSKQYGIQGFPTYVVLGPDGTELGRLGADRTATPEKFIEELKQVLVIQNIAELLSAEDYAAYQAAVAEQKAAEADMEAWQAKTKAEFDAKMATLNAAVEKVESFKAKALEK